MRIKNVPPILIRARAAALAKKYSPNQPRVPAGSGRESGQWTNGGLTAEDRPRVIIDTADFDKKPIVDSGDPDTNRLFHIAPVELNGEYAQLASDNSAAAFRRIHPDSTYETDPKAARSLE